MAGTPIQDPIPTLPAPLQQSLTDARTLHTQNEATLQSLIPQLRRVSGLDPDPSVPTYPTNERNDLPQDFRPQLLEPLFQQASQLLAGLVASQRAYRQLRSQQTNLAGDVLELETLKQINDDETIAQIYNVPFWEAQAAVDSNKAAIAGNSSLTQLLQGEQQNQTLNAAWAAENSEIPFTVNSTGGTIGNHTSQLTPKPPAPTGAETTVFGNSLSTDGGTLGALLAYRSADYSFKYATQQLTAQGGPMSARDPYYTWRSQYLAAEASFRERRRDAAFDKLIFKLSKIASPTSFANFSQQIATLLYRANEDVRNAYVRLENVRDGLRIIYNHHCDSLPAAPHASFDISSGYLDVLVEWVRRVALVLNRISVNDQPYIHRVSLRELLEGPGFEEGRNRRTWKFDISAAEFSNLCLLRMRGLSLWVLGEEDVPPGFMVRAPRVARYIYGRGSSAGIEQKLAPCPVGRPLKWSPTTVQVDVSGSNTVFNGSPIGTWEIQTTSKSGSRGIDDIILDIYLVVQHDHR